ncbi:MAG: MlaD family protein [Gammaproteobacteria bacterium]
MESKINYTLVGLFVVLLTSAIIIISLWLSVGFQQQSYNTYLVSMKESVAGLTLDAPVKYNGVDVGVVKGMKLDKHNPEIVILLLKIKPGTPITETTRAVLMEQGLTGIAYIGLKGGNHSPTLRAKPGQKYPVIQSTPSFLVRLDQAVENLTTSFDGFSTSVKGLLSKQNLTNVSNTLRQLDQITKTFAENSDNLSDSMASLAELLQYAAKASHGFPAAIDNLKTGAAQVALTAKNANNTIQSITTQILPPAYDALQNINVLTGNLDGLTTELKQNPGVIISGAKPPKPGPGE